jgi:phage anti-repressor protein
MTTKTNGNLTALLPVEKSFYQGVTTYHVNARALHGFLENKTRFNDWFKRLVDEYGFVENEDYSLVCYSNLSNKKRTRGSGGHNRIDYKITLNMAKEISMVDKSPQGKAAHRYFIACEERLSQIAPEIHQQELARWKQSRELAKSPFKSMNNALERMRTRQRKSTTKNHYINESNMLTGIVLGQSVQRFKADNHIQGDVREHLNTIQLERLEYLERANEMLLDSDIQDFEERCFKLVAMLANRFKQAA